VHTALRGLRHEALKEGGYLVPVRVFIGVGWLRAFAEKAVEPGWRDGTSLSAFLEGRLDAGAVVFPTYQALLGGVFLPHAALLSWIVMLGQLLAGIAIVSGSLTNAALLGGIFMNVNFLLAGVPDPSAFYIVIQAVLVLAGAGAILGFDAWLVSRIRSPLLVGKPAHSRSEPLVARSAAVALAALALGCAMYAIFHVQDWTPGGSVRDPAAILAVLSAMTASWATIVALGGEAEHHRVTGKQVPAPNGSFVQRNSSAKVSASATAWSSGKTLPAAQAAAKAAWPRARRRPATACS
jgi:thiosulfate dehydrogenase [quinone] large subunit